MPPSGPPSGRRIAGDNRRWGSDHIADLLAALGIAALALTPGSSFRGLHDSIVNRPDAQRGPQPLLFLHEEHAVAAAHGYAKVAGRPMAVALHSNVGLMHATMAIFNAWCDRVPMLLLGAQGPMDAAARRPWVDWVHTASDLGALIRGYTKWDNQPASLPAALEAILRACQIAQTAPAGPTYVCLDQSLQEVQSLPEALADAGAIGDIARFQPPLPGEPPDEAVAAIATALRKAARPLLLVGRVAPDQAAWDRRVQLAEMLGADVLTDLKVGARFPTRHPAHREPPGLSTTAGGLAMIREADVVVSLDWVDLGGTLRLAHAGRAPRGTIVQCSLDQYSHNGWSMAHQSLPPADIAVLADPDRLVVKLLAVTGRDGAKVARPQRTAPAAPPAAEPAGDGPMPLQAMAEATAAILAPEKPCYIRLPIGWPGDVCDFTAALDYLGFDGAGGIGSGPGMAVGAALALQGSERLPVAIIGDGDFLMSVTALWTAVHLRLPLLMLVANNRSFFNDELHQDRMARERGRPVENRGVAIRIDDPAPDLATLARGQGAVGYGPVATLAALRSTLRVAIAKARGGAVCVVDVHVAREYARGIPAAVLREQKS